MSMEDFWLIIEDARRGSERIRDVPSQLSTRLAQLSVEEIVSFETNYQTCMDNAYDMRLWAAAYVICGGCSDDGFTDFRAWLIAHGKDAYTKALNDPDALSDIYDPSTDDTEGQLEEVNYAAVEAFSQKTGQRDWGNALPAWTPPEIKNEVVWDGRASGDALHRIVPKLASKYL